MGHGWCLTSRSERKLAGEGKHEPVHPLVARRERNAVVPARADARPTSVQLLDENHAGALTLRMRFAACRAVLYPSPKLFLMTPSLLILTDFFRAANAALDYATNLAGPLGARLVLLHVRRDSLLDPELLTDELSDLSRKATALALSRMTHDLAVPVVAEVGHGRVADAVADAVARHHSLLVVLGRPDYSAIPDELVQTTALDLLRTAPYPILVVPHQLGSSTLPRRVLLAVDGEDFTLGPHAGAMRYLSRTLGVELTVLHVAPDAAADVSEDEVLASVRRTGVGVDLPVPMRFRRVVAARPAAGIMHVVEAGDTDLVVLLARPRSFWGQLFHHSVTAEVLLHSPVPVLVLPTIA